MTLPEVAESGQGAILPTWTHVDNVNVRTSRELWESMRLDGWNVEVGPYYLCYVTFTVTFCLVSSVCLFRDIESYT